MPTIQAIVDYGVNVGELHVWGDNHRVRIWEGRIYQLKLANTRSAEIPPAKNKFTFSGNTSI